MNKKELVNVLNVLYPAPMTDDAEAFRQREATSYVKPTKAYMDTPITLIMFRCDFSVMSNPSPVILSPKEALHDCAVLKSQLDKTYHEVHEPNTRLDKSIYTPFYFERGYKLIAERVTRIKDYQKKHGNDMYAIFEQPCGEPSIVRPLTKAMVEYTVMVASKVYAEQHDRNDWTYTPEQAKSELNIFVPKAKVLEKDFYKNI